MKRNILGVFAAFAAASILVAAQSQSPNSTPYGDPAATPARAGQSSATAPPAASSSSTSDKSTIVTGCLIQGSSPTVFILDNAKADPQDKSEQAKSYVLAAASGSVDFKAQLNHEVMVSGSAAAAGSSSSMSSSSTASSASGKLDEKSLPKLTARTVSRMSDTCTTAAS